ncbi:MAG: 4'-phosphopantetheinyl transferase superfamily protein [Oscillospiraceae bacterium]|nr:4'-phosphopantetheinyl transferase superfamily protein [Oscillospiraceae bacterium]
MAPVRIQERIPFNKDMGISCGIDIVEIVRIKKALERARFVDRVYTQSEAEYCISKKSGRYQSFAARFAAKEATLKALGAGASASSRGDVDTDANAGTGRNDGANRSANTDAGAGASASSRGDVDTDGNDGTDGSAGTNRDVDTDASAGTGRNDGTNRGANTDAGTDGSDGTDGGALSFRDIEVINDSRRGRPEIVLHNGAKAKYEQIMAKSITLSMSHCREYAVATVVIEI